MAPSEPSTEGKDAEKTEEAKTTVLGAGPAAKEDAEDEHQLPAARRSSASSTLLLADVSSQYQKIGVAASAAAASPAEASEPEKKASKGDMGLGCMKQHQLPMFLSKTYHMIDRCDPEIATWSPQGDNFVVKNVEKFSSEVLPMYFKHSNFSSFARQLNFYGFRKLKAEPILTADYDARTASYVRFFHEKFQKDKPELLHGIRRATKSEHQSKDDLESLRDEVMTLRDRLERNEEKMEEFVMDANRKITNLWNELSMLSRAFNAARAMPPMYIHQSHPASMRPYMGHHHPGAVPPGGPDNMMQSLSHIAGVKLQSPSVQSQKASLQPQPMALNESTTSGSKRSAPESESGKPKSSDDTDETKEPPTTKVKTADA